MVEKIFIKSGENYDPIPLKVFSLEKPLKKIIIEHPELIPISEISQNLELYPISSELETNHGPLDILGVDGKGQLYIIETKLYKNKSGVRKLMAQAWDYSGGLSTFRNDFELFEQKIKRANQGEEVKDTILENKALEDLLKNIETEEDDIVSKIKKNFNECNFSHILVLDRADEQLKDNIKLYNEKNTNPMYVVTISNFILEGTEKEIVISSIFGTESAIPSKSQRNYNRWINEGEEVFFKNLNSNKDVSVPEKNTVKEFIADLKILLGDEPNSDSNYIGYYDWGEGSETPRFFAHFYQIGYSKNWNAAATFNIDEDGSLRFRYPNRSTKNAQEFAEKFNEELRNIPCAKKILEKIDSGYRKPLWEVKDWVLCKDEFMKVIRKVCQPVEY